MTLIELLKEKSMKETPIGNNTVKYVFDYNVFAKLIVKECTDIVLHYTNVDEGVAAAKKHFGVEE